MEAFFFAGLIAVGVVESILSAIWQPHYCRLGIPVFRCAMRVQGSAPPPSAHALERTVPNGPYSPMAFRDVGAGAYAFRETMFGGRTYSAIMRGVVRFEPDRELVAVTGYLNWFGQVPICV